MKAKESRKYLTNLERRRIRRLQAEEQLAQQQLSPEQGFGDPSAFLDAQTPQRA